MVRHVFEAIAFNAGLTMHIELLHGRDPHHIAEAEFKGFCSCISARPSSPMLELRESLQPRALCEPNFGTEDKTNRIQPRVVVLDYGSGNVHSVAKALQVAGASVSLNFKFR
jgi:hypothetical protein